MKIKSATAFNKLSLTVFYHCSSADFVHELAAQV